MTQDTDVPPSFVLSLTLKDELRRATDAWLSVNQFFRDYQVISDLPEHMVLLEIGVHASFERLNFLEAKDIHADPGAVQEMIDRQLVELDLLMNYVQQTWGLQNKYDPEADSIIAIRDGLPRVRQLFSSTSSPLEIAALKIDEELYDIPSNDARIHFVISDGKIAIGPPSLSDNSGDHLDFLSSLLPELREAVSNAMSLLPEGGNTHPDLAKALSRYSECIKSDVGEINFAVLAARGSLLGNLVSAAENALPNDIVPSLSHPQNGALQGLMAVHGPFIYATGAGRAFIEDGRQYNATKTEVARLAAASSLIVAGLQEQDLAGADSVSLLREISNDVGKGPHADRSSALAVSTFSGLASSMMLAGFVGVPYALSGMSTVAAGFLAFFAIESAKRSKFAQVLFGVGASLIDDPLKMAKFAKLAEFVVVHEEAIREIIGPQPDKAYLHRWLDKIKLYVAH